MLFVKQFRNSRNSEIPRLSLARVLGPLRLMQIHPVQWRKSEATIKRRFAPEDQDQPSKDASTNQQ
jgi:hypothetical protein